MKKTRQLYLLQGNELAVEAIDRWFVFLKSKSFGYSSLTFRKVVIVSPIFVVD